MFYVFAILGLCWLSICSDPLNGGPILLLKDTAESEEASSDEFRSSFYEDLKLIKSPSAEAAKRASALNEAVGRWSEFVGEQVDEERAMSTCRVSAWYPLLNGMIRKLNENKKYAPIGDIPKWDELEKCPRIDLKYPSSLRSDIVKGFSRLLEGPVSEVKRLLTFNYLRTERLVANPTNIASVCDYEWLSRIVIVDTSDLSEIVSEHKGGGYNLKLIGRIRAGKRGMWSEYLENGKWQSSLSSRQTEESVSDATLFLFYEVVEIEDLNFLWLEAFRGICGKTSLSRSRESPGNQDSLVSSFNRFRFANGGLLNDLLAVEYVHLSGPKSRFPDSCSSEKSLRGLIYHVDIPPEILVICKPVDSSSEWITHYFTKTVYVGVYNNCMNLRSTIQSKDDSHWNHLYRDGKWIDSRSKDSIDDIVDDNTVAVVYEHNKSCDGIQAATIELDLQKKDLVDIVNRQLSELPTADEFRDKLKAALKESTELVSDKLLTGSASMLVEHVKQLEYLRDYTTREFIDIPVSKQIMKIRHLIEIAKSIRLMVSLGAHRSQTKSIDEDLPMSYGNLDGSCFVNVVLHVLFNLRRFRHSIRSIQHQQYLPLKEALEEIAKLKYEGASIASVLKFRESLVHWQFCNGGDNEEALKYVIDANPNLRRYTAVVNFHDTEAAMSAQRLIESSSSDWKVNWFTEVIIISVKNVKEGYRPYANLEIEKYGHVFDLVATVQSLPNHATAKVRVWSEKDMRHKWYYMDNDEGLLIDTKPDATARHKETPEAIQRPIIDDQTSILVYEKRRGHGIVRSFISSSNWTKGILLVSVVLLTFIVRW